MCGGRKFITPRVIHTLEKQFLNFSELFFLVKDVTVKKDHTERSKKIPRKVGHTND